MFVISKHESVKGELLNLQNPNSLLNYTANFKNVYYNHESQIKGIDTGDLYVNSEIRIARIRFKPGYQRI
jgi:hypothetical protein